MKNKKIKRNRQVIKDLKDCFQAFWLETEEGHPGANYDFSSLICNDHSYATILTKYNWEVHHVIISISLHLKLEPERITEVLELLNLFNQACINYQYSVCPRCFNVSIQSSLDVPGSKLPKEKFKKLLSLLLEETYHGYPLIDQLLLTDGCTPQALLGGYVDEQRQYLNKGGKFSNTMKEKIIRDMQAELNHLGIAVGKREQVDKGFMFQYSHPLDHDLKMQAVIVLYERNETVIIRVSAPLTLPDEKRTVVADLANRINRICGADHMYISDQSRRVILSQGILLNEGYMDATEFRETVQLLQAKANLVFPVFKNLLESDESPEALMSRIFNRNHRVINACH